MEIEVLKSKIHRVTVTNCDLNYIGSITIDETLLDAAKMIPGEKVQVVNINNGERLETYIIKGKKRKRRGNFKWACGKKSAERRQGNYYQLCKDERK